MLGFDENSGGKILTQTQSNQQEDLDLGQKRNTTDFETELCKSYDAEGSRRGKWIRRWTMGWRQKHSNRIDANPTVYFKLWCYLMEMGFPIFSQVMLTMVLKEHDTPIRPQIKRPKPYNLSTMTPLVINCVTNQVDLTKKANPYLRNEEHKQELKSMQLNWESQTTEVWLRSRKWALTTENGDCSKTDCS